MDAGRLVQGLCTAEGNDKRNVCVYRDWEAEVELRSDTPAFEDWIVETLDREIVQNSDIDIDMLCVSRRPKNKCLRYGKIKAFGNHFRVDDNSEIIMKTYDSGVATVADDPVLDARDVSSINYVGVLKDILKLDYGPVRSSIILLRCEWIKKFDNRNNPNTYVRDESGFLMVNFKHKLPKMQDPFIFPSQATQVFFSDDRKKPGWKVVLRKDPRARREVVDSSDVFYSTSVDTVHLMTPTVIPPPPEVPSLEGAVELTNEDHLLAVAAY